MQIRLWVFWGIIAILSLATVVSAQQGVRWEETSVEGAKRRAAQTGRLILIHFWAPSCAPCLNMERNVFSLPEVAGAIEANYVPVKINADHFPHTCQQFGITALPTDLILTAGGQPLRRFQGEAPPDVYVGRLNEIAASVGRRPIPACAQRPNVPPGAAAGPAASATTNPTPSYQAPNWGGYVNNRPEGGPGPGQSAELAQAIPQYGQQPVAPQYGRQTVAQEIPSPGDRDNRQPSGPPAESRQGIPPDGLPASPPDSLSPALGQSAPAPQVAEGNPPLGLEGFCPVELTEKRRWVLGNRQWGAIHRGRTYLFAGPEEQRRFLDDPDRYAPVISGDDVVLSLERGQSVTGRRQHGVFFRGHVYLFSDEASLGTFAKNPTRYAEQVLQTMRPGRGVSYR